MQPNPFPFPNPFPTPDDVARASAAPLAEMAKKLTQVLAEGRRAAGIPYGLVPQVIACMEAQGWKVSQMPSKDDPVNFIELIFDRVAAPSEQPPTT